MGHPESPLLRNFKTLMSKLSGVTEIQRLDCMIYVEPFLEIIRSDETSGPITGIVLHIARKHFVCGVIYARACWDCVCMRTAVVRVCAVTCVGVVLRVLHYDRVSGSRALIINMSIEYARTHAHTHVCTPTRSYKHIFART